MSAPDASMDRPLHLSLPDWRTALKRRVKRPKRPSFWLLWTLLYVALDACSVIASDWLAFIADTAAVGYGYWMVVNHRDRIVWRYYLPVFALCCMPFTVGVIA